MAEAKAETKVTKVESLKTSPNDGLLTTWIGYSTELAERSTTTAFAIARDVRSELNQRILGTLQFLESSQAGAFKLARTIDERVDKLAEEVIDTAESVALGLIRIVRDTGTSVTGVVARAA
jgi:hypothetical protein